MSQVRVQGDPGGTGIFTIASPNSNSNVTFTLPTTSGTVLTNAGPYTANASASNGAVTIDASNNVGIGTSSPQGRLHVAGDIFVASNSNVQWSAFSAGTSGVLLAGDSANNRLDAYTTGTLRTRIDSSGNMMWNGTNTTTQNGNVGYIYKFFGGGGNIVVPFESSVVDRYATLEYRRTGRASGRASQISIGENSANQGDVQVYSSNANADISGGVRLSNGATSWSAISDMRLKTVTGAYANALQDIAKIQAIKFTWKHDQSGTPQVGVSAQSVELVVPEAISTSKNIATPDDETEYLSVRYTELIPLMIASIQELKAEVDALKAQLGAQA